jgi:hypothetical protein
MPLFIPNGYGSQVNQWSLFYEEIVDAVEEWDMKVPQEKSSFYLPAKGEYNSG